MIDYIAGPLNFDYERYSTEALLPKVSRGIGTLSLLIFQLFCSTSRHGELERNYRILQALAMKHSVSPTDFALSVHNSAVGTLTIAAQQPLVSSSLAAGVETFQQGLCEVLALHQGGYSRVLMVDFDGVLPDFYHRLVPPDMSKYPFAVALLIEPGEALHCMTLPARYSEPNLPQSLQFLQGWLGQKTPFVVTGGRFHWHWSG